MIPQQIQVAIDNHQSYIQFMIETYISSHSSPNIQMKQGHIEELKKIISDYTLKFAKEITKLGMIK